MSEKKYKAKDKPRWFREEQLCPAIPVAEPQPVRWRDGAVEVPKVGTLIRFIYKSDNMSKEPCAVFSITVPHVAGWGDTYWLPAAEFPMPPLPESKPVIEPCIYCGGVCTVYTDRSTRHWVVCAQECGYSAEGRPSESKAIEAHNAIARKVRG